MDASTVKRKVRKRDGYRCTDCGITEEAYRAVCGKSLEVHRIQPGTPYTVEGARTLCGRCHLAQPRSPRGTSDVVMLRLPRAVLREALGGEIPDVSLHDLVLRLVRAVHPDLRATVMDDLRRESAQATETFRLKRDLVSMARTVCTRSADEDDGPLSLSAYLDSLVRPAITRDYNDIMERLGEER